MKKIYLSLLVVATAVGMSSFVNAPKKTVKFDSFYYVLTSSTTYQKTATAPSDDNCQNAISNKCWIEYSADKGESFPATSIPTTNKVAESSHNGLYVE